MKYVCWLFACFFTIAVFGQEKLHVKGKYPDLYIEHTVKDGESLQGVSNQFGITSAKLASYNQFNPASPLPKNKKIRIPISKENLLQQKNSTGEPVYHTIQKGDNLYRLSLAYNKVSTATIKEWNNMKTDIVKDGQLIIIGYIGTGKSVEEKKETPAKQAVVTDNTPVKQVPPVVKPADKKEPDPSIVKPGKAAAAPPVNVDTKKEETQQVTENKKETANNNTIKDSDEGYFAVNYSQHAAGQAKQFHSGDAAVFKTISGWTDRKYYVLMNDVAIGTIVRITGTTNKNVCAKVLGPLQETKTGTGLLLRMSNSAAAALGALDAKFTVTVTYFE